MFKKLVITASLVLFIPQIFALLAEVNWFFELWIHYIAYYTIIAALLILICIKNGLWKTATALTLILALNLPVFVSYYQTPSQIPAAGEEIKVFSANFFYLNEDFETIKTVIEDEDPDVIAILEANIRWIAKKDEYKEKYPYTYITDDFGPFGIVVMSKFPAEFKQIKWGEQNAIEAVIEGKYKVLAVHTHAPVHKSWAAARNNYFEELADEINRSELPTVVMGDFNSTPWSPYFKDIIEKTSLKEARMGYGLVPTWNANLPLFWIPIDHILTTDDIEVLDFHRGAYTSADHYPVVASLRLP